MFNILGLFLACAPSTVTRRMFWIYKSSALLFAAPEDRRRQILAFAAISLGLIAIGILCLITSWAMKHERAWGRWVGLLSSALLVPCSPWFTPFGVAGLYFFVWSPPVMDQRAVADYSRLRPRDSLSQWIVSIFAMGLWILACGRLTTYARSLGLPTYYLGNGFWYILFLGQLVVVSIHEFGHMSAAWAVGFRFKALCIGPLVTWKDAAGPRHFRFEWRRLLMGGGYAGSVPTSEHSLRLNQILVIFAGPFLSLNAGLLLFLAFLRLPGSAFEHHWRVIGYTSLLFVADFIGNLIPLGYTDGTLLWHLILWTPKGREFSSAWFSAKHHEEADQLQSQVDFEHEAEMRRRVVEQAVAHGEQPSVELAHKFLELGFSQLRALRLQEAEQNLLRSREIVTQCRGVNAVLEANAWLGLHRVYQLQHRSDKSMEAGRSAILAFARTKDKLAKPALVEVQSAQAQLHIDLGEYYEALREVDEALSDFPSGRKFLLKKAALYRLKANCEFHIGTPGPALAAIRSSVDVLCSDQIQDSDRAQAASDLALAGIAVWNAGRNAQAIAILSDAIRRLEQNGAVQRSVRLRIVLSEVLRKVGRFADAEAALPAEAGLSPANLESLLSARAQIELRSGRVQEAVTSFERALELKKNDPQSSPSEIATAESLLGEAMLDSGRIDEAETLTRRSLHTLQAAGHPDAAGALITLAFLQHVRGIPNSTALVDEAMELIVKAPLLETASRARFLESEAERLDRYGFAIPAGGYRTAAAVLWEQVGAVQESPELSAETAPAPELQITPH